VIAFERITDVFLGSTAAPRGGG